MFKKYSDFKLHYKKTAQKISLKEETKLSKTETNRFYLNKIVRTCTQELILISNNKKKYLLEKRFIQTDRKDWENRESSKYK